MARSCDNCGSRMAPFFPRSKSIDGERYLCPTCKGKEAALEFGVAKVAHDSGDGETIYHCPFCGAGQVLGRSDGTAECQFCGTAFTVQVQPSMSAVPQTIDGEPHVHPDMPGSDPGTPLDTEEDPIETETDLAPGEEEEGMDDVPQNPFTSKLYRTEQGAGLSRSDYIRHLAIKHSDDREMTLARVRKVRAMDDGHHHTDIRRAGDEWNWTWFCYDCGEQGPSFQSRADAIYDAEEHSSAMAGA